MIASVFSFGRHKRLLSSEAYKYVFENPTTAQRTRYFTLLGRKNTLDVARLGIIVGKKQIRKAVQRNRVKRIIRESFRLQQGQLPPLDIIVIAKHGLAQMTSAEIRTYMDRLWKNLSA